MVVDNELPTLLEGHRVSAAVRVWKSGCSHLASAFASIFGFALGDDLLLASAHHLHAAIGICQNAWLNGVEFLSIVDGTDDFPCFSKILRGLKVNPPTPVLRAGGTKDGAIG